MDQTPLFQSQLGSIGARVRAARGGGVMTGFNPSLVRLALWRAAAALLAWTGFNPSLVRLAHGGIRGVAVAEHGFNPSLVRLAPWPD